MILRRAEGIRGSLAFNFAPRNSTQVTQGTRLRLHKLVVQLRERYRRLITRGIVAFNFSPRNLTQVTSAMKPVQDTMVGFSSVKRITLREGLY